MAGLGEGGDVAGTRNQGGQIDPLEVYRQLYHDLAQRFEEPMEKLRNVANDLCVETEVLKAAVKRLEAGASTQSQRRWEGTLMLCTAALSVIGMFISIALAIMK